jgi:hypothetical protein
MKGSAMSKTQEFFEQIKSGEQPTLIENIQEAASSLKDIGGGLWDTLKPAFDHGRSEIVAAIFSDHDGHVMYMKNQQNIEQNHDQEPAQETPEHQRDGREM